MNITIDYLSHRQDLAAEVARLWLSEWSIDKSERGLEKQEVSISKKLNDRIPFVLVAMDGDALVGTIAIFEHDLESRPDLSPWLGGVLVVPEYRGRGIAKQLVAKAELEARKWGVSVLYLHTETAAGLYAKLGWKNLENCLNDSGEESIIMSKQLNA